MSSNRADGSQQPQDIALLDEADQSLPRYARANIASRLPDYTNSIQENIRAAFMPNNYRSISSIHPGAAVLAQSSSLASNSDKLHPFKVGFHGGRATFSDFAYACSPFDLAEETKVRERQAHEEKMRSVGGEQPFFAGYNNFRLKHELDGTQFEYVSEPYESPIEARMREKWLEDSQRNPRPFLPPGAEKALAKPTRALLGDAMTALYRNIMADWREVQPTVISTAEDLIVIYFQAERVSHTDGVLAYMNNALRRDDAVLAYDLRRVPEGWNVRTDDGRHLMFTFRPPWVRPRAFVVADGIPPPPAAAAGAPAAA